MGLAGQQRLLESKVLLIGAGGLGCPLALYLAAAGVGELGLVDDDVVSSSNLQRQVLYGTRDVGRPKVEVAAERIRALNPDVEVEGHRQRLDSSTALELFAPYDVVVDGTDNFPTRYLSNDACVLLGKPNVYGSIFRFDGQASVFNFEGGPCYRCLYPEPPDPGLVPSCAEGGVLGVLPGIVGLIQANEAIKIILGKGKTLSGRLLLFDAMGMKFREMKVRKDPKCPICGENPTIKELIDYKEFCGVPADAEQDTSEAAKVQAQSPWDITPRQLKDKMDAGEDFFLLDVRNPNEYEICEIGGTLIPLPEFGQRFVEVPKDKEVIVHCKMGGRSAKAVQFLRDQGYDNVFNVNGGILAWAEQVDPSLPKY